MLLRIAAAWIPGVLLVSLPAGSALAQEPASLKIPGLESLSLDGSIRLRAESRRPSSVSSATDAAWGDVFQRTRLGLNFKASPRLGGRIEFQDSRTWGEDASLTADAPGFFLRQGYLSVDGLGGGRLTVNAGRMVVPALGDQRLLSPLDWSNVGRAWDGLQASFKGGPWAAEGFSADSRNSLRKSAGGRDVLLLSGLQVRRVLGDKAALEVLILGRTLRQSGLDETASLRGEIKQGRFKMSAEGVLQGTDGSKRRAEAWACALKAEMEATRRISVSAEHSAASGDPDAGDGLRRTFDPVLNLSHVYLGHADLVGWKNIRSFMAGLKVKLREGLFAQLDGHSFSLVDAQDAWYGASGAVLRTDPTGQAGKALGREADLYVKGKLGKGMTLWGGYSRFQPGAFIKATGGMSPTDWVFLQTALDF